MIDEREQQQPTKHSDAYVEEVSDDSQPSSARNRSETYGHDTSILFFGNERLVSGLSSTDAPILRGLIDGGYHVKAVVSHHSDTRSRNARSLEVADIAAEHGIPVLLPNRPIDIYDQLADFHADVAILVAYGRLIPQKIIDLFPLGIINVHPSLLPHYRGPTPIESPILNGDTTTGVSIMQLTAGMDDGPVYAQREFPIAETDTKFDVYAKASAESADLLFSVLPDILDGSLQPTPQDESKATYSKLLLKSDGVLDVTTTPARQAERQVRAYLGFPKTKVTVLGKSIVITKAHVSMQQKTPLDILCADGAFLSIDELVAPSGKTMSGLAFLKGYSK